MKVLLTVLLIITAGMSFAAEQVRKVGEGDPLPKDGFASFEELQGWATGSSFGGGSAVKLNLNGTDVFYSDRMFTSGFATSELLFYAIGSDDRIRAFMIIPTQRKQFRIAVEENQIVVKHYSDQNKDWLIVMKITEAMLPSK